MTTCGCKKFLKTQINNIKIFVQAKMIDPTGASNEIFAGAFLLKHIAKNKFIYIYYLISIKLKKKKKNEIIHILNVTRYTWCVVIRTLIN